jgi:hypothetical protein
MGTADHGRCLVHSQAAHDNTNFYSLTLQITGRIARRGHKHFAQRLRDLIDALHNEPQPTLGRLIPRCPAARRAVSAPFGLVPAGKYTGPRAPTRREGTPRSYPRRTAAAGSPQPSCPAAAPRVSPRRAAGHAKIPLRTSLIWMFVDTRPCCPTSASALLSPSF